eukprot:CAMPEP_0184074348 /NCGR_PEP_ID=MMETSP0957-20130417/68550_1 /TAXON_ID=627963 /ORGANISM="Aplanochytrium sp, Strain PBS07" /LENGTH=61 /DNA_ID=CAMNT_0026376457 /DNA_START=51 /DNA_END=232 /DNA_ORIENTATION=-
MRIVAGVVGRPTFALFGRTCTTFKPKALSTAVSVDSASESGGISQGLNNETPLSPTGRIIL